MEDEDFDYKAAEQREQDILLDKGLEFTVGGREFLIKQPVLGQLDKLSALFLKLDVDHEKLTSDNPRIVFEEQKRMIAGNVKTLAEIVAVASVDHIGVPKGMWERLIKLIRVGLLIRRNTNLFYWNMNPTDLMKLTSIILRASNLSDFSTSIALLSVNRTTAPQAIEE